MRSRTKDRDSSAKPRSRFWIRRRFRETGDRQVRHRRGAQRWKGEIVENVSVLYACVCVCRWEISEYDGS